METFGFWGSWFAWRDAMITALLSAAALAYLGVWIVLKRVVYVPLALAQVSSFGVVLSYLLGSSLGIHSHDAEGCSTLFDPSWLSLAVALATAFWFAKPQADSSLAIVVTYLLSGAAVLILGGLVKRDLHDVQSVLFGDAVLVDLTQLIYVGSAAIVVAMVHGMMHRQFLFVSFDPDAAGAAGIHRFRVEVMLYATFALMISVATRALGALPAFGLMVLPAMTGLRLARTMRRAFTISVGLGMISAGFGYYLSFRLGLPTGASMVSLAGVIYVASLSVRSAKVVN